VNLTSYIRALQEKKLIDKNIQVLAATINMIIP
jgi:hypothetical protein